MTQQSLPHRVAVVGGGRWARNIVRALLEVLPPEWSVSIHSRHSSNAMRAWMVGRSDASRWQVFDRWPSYAGDECSRAVVIANAARDHLAAAIESLQARVPVLVEKPLAISEAGARRLITIAAENQTLLGVSQVFLFARYLECFAEIVASRAPLKEIRIEWIDPGKETRHGEQKRYDPGLPIIQDLLPHVCALIWRVTSEPVEFEGIEIARGGARVELSLRAGGVRCRAFLVRNGEARRRTLAVRTSKDDLHLDFSSEPGTIDAPGETIDGDPEWSTGERPLARMLRTFLRSITENRIDARLSAEHGLAACRLADRAMQDYSAMQQRWIKSRLDRWLDDDLRYALTELACVARPGTDPIDADLIEVRRRVRDSGRSGI